ncbi:MAG: T9SS type A sorting domain-containing protein [Crocinitomicaceae bacterium]|nr:T9SS type A sorting domain-containing protein [Crocinitomicaceae bacterium]
MRRRVHAFSSRLPKKQGDRTLAWEARGPINKGGRSRALAVDRTNENILIAGSVTGGMWRSTDGGLHWTKTTAPEQLHSVSCVIQDPRAGHESTWYMGTGEEFYGVVSGTSFSSLFSGDGMFKSTDGGVTWQQLASTASHTPQNILQNGSYDFIWNIIVDHTIANQDVLYAAVFNGIIRSVDGGNTWEHVLGFTSSPSEFSNIMITPSGVLYATFSDNGTNGGGFYRSVNGTEWTSIDPVVPEISNLRRTLTCINPQNENEVYFFGETIGNSNYPIDHFLYKYTYINGDGSNAGGTWENRSLNLPDTPCELFIGVDFDFGTFRSQYSYDLCLAHHPTEPNVLFIGGINIHRSDDAFATDNSKWIGGYRCNEANPIDYSYPSHHSDQHSFAFLPSNSHVMFNSNDGGLYRTDNCLADSVSWTPLNHGYVTTQFYTVAMEQGQATGDFVIGGMQDNGTWLTHSSDNGVNWKEVHADDGAYCAIPQGRNYIITSSQEGRMYKKIIGPEGQLLSTERIDPQNGPTALFINPLLIDPWNNDDLFIAGNKTLWYLPQVSSIPVTGNYLNPLPNNQWVQINASTVPTTAGSISCLDKPLIDNSIIYYATTQGRAYRIDDCYGTPVRTVITGAEFPSNSYASCITANDFNPDEVLLSFSPYNIPSIFHTTDGGANWTDVSGNLEENPDGTGAGPAVYWVEIYSSEPAIYFAGTSAGLFSTQLLDGANTVWEMEGSETIGNMIINMVTARPFDGKISIGTHGNGIYTAQLPPVEAASVENFSVLQNKVSCFPNPFSTEINFFFHTKESLTSVIEIYDIVGKKADTLRVEGGKPGERYVKWKPAGELTQGTYLYIIRTGREVRTGKVIYSQ